jgi:hypothetical protein
MNGYKNRRKSPSTNFCLKLSTSKIQFIVLAKTGNFIMLRYDLKNLTATV